MVFAFLHGRGGELGWMCTSAGRRAHQNRLTAGADLCEQDAALDGLGWEGEPVLRTTEPTSEKETLVSDRDGARSASRSAGGRYI